MTVILCREDRLHEDVLVTKGVAISRRRSGQIQPHAVLADCPLEVLLVNVEGISLELEMAVADDSNEPAIEVEWSRDQLDERDIHRLRPMHNGKRL